MSSPPRDPGPHVRPLTAADLPWVVELARARRARLEPHAPCLWRAAGDATDQHLAHLTRLVADPATLSVRTDHGFLIGVPRERYLFVDDLVVADDRWAGDGEALLRRAMAASPRLRVVVPAAEAARRTATERLGLVAVETWWHRDLPVVQVRRPGGRLRLTTAGATGSLVTAPPVYDPGGPVLLVTEVDGAGPLAALEREAAERGATVSVVSQRPDDLFVELLLTDAGHLLTTLFVETPVLGPASAG